MESLFAARLNGLLQQNLPEAVMRPQTPDVRFEGQSDCPLVVG
jgi:hypothetical protein